MTFEVTLYGMLDASVTKDSTNIYGNFNQIVFFFFC